MGKLCKIGRAIPAFAIAMGMMAAAVNCYATSTSHTMTKTESRTFYHGESGVYYLEAGYDFGSWLPFDDAGLWTKSGAKAYHYREVYAKLDGVLESHHIKSFSAIGRGVDTIEGKMVNYGIDFDTGYGWAKTYNTYTSSAYVTNTIYLKVTN